MGVGLPVRLRFALKYAADGGVFVVAVALAYLLRFDRFPSGVLGSQAWAMVAVLPLARLAAGRLCGTHRISWRLMGLSDAITLIRATASVTALLLATRLLMPWLAPGWAVVPLGVIALEGLASLSGVFAIRVAMRLADERHARARNLGPVTAVRRRAILVGAGRAGRTAALELRQRPDAGFEPVAFLDDDPTRAGQVIEGVPVLGTTADAEAVAAQVFAQDIIMTMPSASPERTRRIVERCRVTGLPLQTVPGLYELISGAVGITRIRPVKVEALLGRSVVELDNLAVQRVGGAFAGKRVLVTGAGGSIGSELCRQLAALRPAQLILVENNENNLFEIEQSMQRVLGDRTVACLVDVREEAQVRGVFAAYEPEVVFHAAAFKHVPMMERHPEAAISNNVGGTRVVVEAAHRHGVERFVLISTDKAVNPTSVMGASKRVAELVVHGEAAGGSQGTPPSSTRSCAVRFGNVLGSRGSVLHTFRTQIERGGPVTVTHPEVTRFFMTIPEAVRLVLQAGALGTGGETYLLDMGESVRILDMARQMIQLAGLTEAEVPIQIVGLRPGEKLREELLRDGETSTPSGVAGINLARATDPSDAELGAWVVALERAAAVHDVAGIRCILARLTGYCEPGATATDYGASESQIAALVASA